MKPNFKALAEGYRQKWRAASERNKRLVITDRIIKITLAEMEREIASLKAKYKEALDCIVELQEAIIMKEASPTADVVEVTRCKDCKHYRAYEPPIEDFDGWCSVNENEYDKEFYCQYGERREK